MAELNTITTKSDLINLRAELLNDFRELLQVTPPVSKKEWVRTSHLIEHFGWSAGKIQDMRIKHQIPWSKIGDGTIMYPLHEIEQLLESLKNPASK